MRFLGNSPKGSDMLYVATLCLTLLIPAFLPPCATLFSRIEPTDASVAAIRQNLYEVAALARTTIVHPAAQDGITIPLSVNELGRELAVRYKGRSPTRRGAAMPGISSHLAPLATTPTNLGYPVMALTLDACDGTADMRIVELVRRLRVPVTLFITNRWLNRNKAMAADLAKDPLFSFAAHGARHRPAFVDGRSAFGIKGTADIPELVEEVETNARAIAALTGKRPAWFRSGTAHYDDLAVAVIHALELDIAGYTISADAGATLPAAEVARRTLAAGHGAIILAHINHPESGTAEGLAKALPVMIQAGVRFVHLPTPHKASPRQAEPSGGKRLDFPTHARYP